MLTLRSGLAALLASILIIYTKPTDAQAYGNNLKYFYFPSPDTSVEIIFNDTDSLQNSGLKPAAKTFVLLDGFGSNLTSTMNMKMQQAFSLIPDTNLIIVDWSYYNGLHYLSANLMDIIFAYVTAMQSVSSTGEDLANFFQFLRANKQIEFGNITILSHSLGCNAAGSTGRHVQRLFGSPIGRIVGLDPALQFTQAEATIRLQVGDASVVEIYHTAMKAAGEAYPATGDVIIYPNGGKFQPCEDEDGTPGIPGCSNHWYSWMIYTYSLSNSTMKACPCSGAACHCQKCSFECGDKGISIGPHIPETARGSYHIKTGFVGFP